MWIELDAVDDMSSFVANNNKLLLRENPDVKVFSDDADPERAIFSCACQGCRVEMDCSNSDT
jgi:hypothetical protein